jgi:uncharacterized OB-fold protein
MASCNECGAEISPRAKACPKCGEPEPAKSSYEGLIAFIVIVSIIVIIIAGNAHK